MWTFLATEVLFFGGLFAGYTVYRYLDPPAFATGSRQLDVTLGAINTGVLLLSSLTMALAVNSAQTDRKKQTVGFLAATLALGLVFLGIKFDEYRHKFEDRLVPGRNFALERLLHARSQEPAGVVGTIVKLGPHRVAIERGGNLAVFAATDKTRVTVNGRAAGVRDLAVGQALEIVAPPDRASADSLRAVSPRAEMFFSFYFAMTGFHALHMLIGVGVVVVVAIKAGRGRFSSLYYTPVEMTGLYWHFVDIVWVFLFPLLYLIDWHP
jgi:cytochrome c oxidase subunit 3